jgi:N-acyl-phosphatidylethanolamine-hydrolysing phospholipase D
VSESDGRSFGDFLRWRRERRSQPRPPMPDPAELPIATARVAVPAAATTEVRVTWVGHSTFLLQAGGLNILTDPVFSERASPLGWIGPRRLVPPGLRFEDLPPIDAVLISHDHYDHLDAPTVRKLRSREGDRTRWITPRGYARWLARRRIRSVTELDWWMDTRLDGPAGEAVVTALPARHWTRRGPFDQPGRQWASFAIDAGPGAKIYFGGDSGYFDGFAEIGARLGPFDVSILPIGAYEPRWFMGAVHMTPEEAVRVYRSLGGAGTLVPSHWGTFRLSFEPPMEPPARLRAAWADAGLPERDLRVLRHGETLTIRRG